MIISWILFVIGIYWIIGLVAGLLLAWKGLALIDPDAKKTGVWFKFMILPGLSVFWPVFVRKWFQARKS